MTILSVSMISLVIMTAAMAAKVRRIERRLQHLEARARYQEEV